MSKRTFLLHSLFIAASSLSEQASKRPQNSFILYYFFLQLPHLTVVEKQFRVTSIYTSASTATTPCEVFHPAIYHNPDSR